MYYLCICVFKEIYNYYYNYYNNNITIYTLNLAIFHNEICYN